MTLGNWSVFDLGLDLGLDLNLDYGCWLLATSNVLNLTSQVPKQKQTAENQKASLRFWFPVPQVNGYDRGTVSYVLRHMSYVFRTTVSRFPISVNQIDHS